VQAKATVGGTWNGGSEEGKGGRKMKLGEIGRENWRGE